MTPTGMPSDPNTLTSRGTIARHRGAIAIALLGIVVSLALASFVEEHDRRRVTAETNRACEMRVSALERAISTREETVGAIRSLYESSDAVTLEEFQTFTAPFFREEAGIQGLGWAAYVESEDLADFERQAREFSPDYRVFALDEEGNRVPPSTEGPHFPMLHTVPGRVAPGFDIASEEVRSIAIRRAVESGQPSASGFIGLLSAPTEPGIVIYVPTYSQGGAFEIGTGNKPDGFAAGGFRVSAIIAAALSQTPVDEFTLAITDLESENQDRVEFKNGRIIGANSADGEIPPAYSGEIAVGGRQWRLDLYPSPEFMAKHRMLGGRLMLTTGLAITLALTILIYNVTDRRKKVERMVEQRTAELSKSEQRFRELANQLPQLVCEADLDGRLIFANRMLKDAFGWKDEEPRGDRSIYDLFPENERERARAHFGQILDGRTPGAAEYGLSLGDGGCLPAIVTANAIIRDSQTVGLRLVVTDISDRKEAELALRLSEERQENALRGADLGLWDWFVGSEEVVYDARYVRMLGYDPGEFQATLKNFMESIHPDDVSQLETALKEHFAHDTPYSVEVRLRKKNGEWLWVLARGRVVERDAEGKPVRMTGTHLDIHERKQAEAVLTRMSRAFEATAEGLVVTDTAGVISKVNPAFERITGYSEQEAIGKKPSILKSGSNPVTLYQTMWKTILSGGAWTGDVINRHKNGTLYDAALTISPIFDRNETIIGFVGAQRDVTDKRQAEQELREAKMAAEQAARAKSEFLANMSHEIRTPLNAIIGMTGLMLDLDLTPTQREYAEIVRNSGDSLLGIINDILDFSKIEAGRLEFENVPFDLRQCVEEIGDLLAPSAYEKGLEMAILIHPRCPTRIKGDPGRLRQVILNLVSNAVKFTESGEVVVRVEMVRVEDEVAILKFSVQDSGIGIPLDRQDRLFRSFSQVDTSTTRRFGGTGLGLAISRRLVEMMHGEIGLVSEEGAGSTFWFTAALGIVLYDETEELGYVLDMSGVRMLVVDDRETNRQVLCGLLGMWGCHCEEATSGQQALEMMKAAALSGQPYATTIVDFQMPDMNGERLAQEIGKDPDLKDIPLILLTSMPQRGDRSRLQLAGFSAYLTKPVKRRQLYEAIGIVLRLKQEPNRKSGEIPLITEETLQEVQTQKIRLLVVEDNAINQKVAIRILAKLGYRCDVAGNGKEAVEALDSIPYDIVLMDCQMPIMDGYEATREIRKREGPVRRTAIIAMTAEALKGDRERCIEAGMEDYISKPVDAMELKAMLHKYTAEKLKESQKHPGEKPGSVDFHSYREACGNDPEFQIEVARVFIEQAEKGLSKISAAAESADMKAARREAHSLKGSSGNIGAMPFMNIMGEVELASRDEDGERLYPALHQATLEFEKVKKLLQDHAEMMAKGS